MTNDPCILVVDDDESTRKSLNLILKRKGYDVVSAETGAVALGIVRSRMIDLTLLDIKLPDIEGVDLLDPLLETNPEMAIFIITGFASVETAVQSLTAGASGYITKPIDLDDMLVKITNALEHQKLVREVREAEEKIEWISKFPEENPNPVLRVRTDNLLLYANKSSFFILKEWNLSVNTNIPDFLKQMVQKSLEDGSGLILERSVGDKTFLLTIAPISGTNYANIYAVDITERKRAEEELNEKNTELESAYEEIKSTEEELHQLNEELEGRVQSRTADLDAAYKELESFTYLVSHDLRAPLRAIHGFSKILMEDHFNELSPEAKRLLTIINENGLKMGYLIDDLLMFSRTGRQPLKKQKVQPNEIINQCLIEQGEEQKGRTIELTIAELPSCFADPVLLKQVWFNLISNAIKFSNKKDIAQITIGSTRKDDETVFFIRDNGAGFSMKYIDKLFGVFQRLHHADEFEGNGVGLAMVKTIISRHGGRLWAESEEEVGATFSFTLGNGALLKEDING